MANHEPKGTTADESDRLRAAILAHPEMRADDLAARLGCSRATVFKIRKHPGPDGRHARRKAQRAGSRIRGVMADADQPRPSRISPASSPRPAPGAPSRPPASASGAIPTPT